MADDPLDILAWTMLGEAGGEGEQGMSDVAHVVLNRIATGKYGADIPAVALAPKQFSTWNSGAGGNDPKGKYPRDSAAFQRARNLAEQVVAGAIPGPPGKPLDYNAPSVSPYWANSKAKHGTYERNGHVFYPSVPVPPGEVPNAVGSLTDTVPSRPPVPVTPSIDMAQMRRISAPTQLIPDSFAALPKRGNGTANLGDSIGLSPIQGGKQQAPMFDAAFDERTGTMRLTREPMDTQGMYVGRSTPPAPVPAQMSPQIAARRATDPVLQAALNRQNPQRLPELAPPMELPRPPIQSASDLARGRSGISTIASIPTTGSLPTTAQILNGTGFRGGGPVEAPDRLVADILPPALFGGNVAGIGERGIAPVPFSRPTQFAQAPRMAPVPFSRPTAVGTALSTRPMPPMPLPRPNFGMGGPMGRPMVAPRPMPVSMRPQSRPLQIVVQGGNGGGSVIAPPSSGYGSKGYSTVISPGGQTMDRNGNWV